MDNKLSELKAAAFSLKNMSDRKAKGLRTSTLQINAAAAKMRGMLTADAVLALLAELAEKDKRIAELEAKLATPVRLPETYSPDPWMGPDPSGTWLDAEDVKDSIRAAGFTVEGDE